MMDSEVVDLEPARIAPNDLYRELRWPDPPGERPLVAVNMVTTLDGKAVVGGRGAGIGSRFDRQVMDRIRSWFDMVLTGAGTLRAEGFNPGVKAEQVAARVGRNLSAQPIAGLVTVSGDIPPDCHFVRRSDLERVVFTCERGVLAHQGAFERLAAVARIVVVGEDTIDLRAAAEFARQELGVRRLLVEGGPTLNQAMLTAGLVDELFLTVAPRLVGGRSLAIVDADVPPTPDLATLRLLSICSHQSELFLRYRVRR